MKKQQFIFYGTAWAAYLTLAFLMFPVWNVSINILMFVLIGMGAWLYGRTLGLWITFYAILFHIALLGFIYEDLFTVYQTKLTSPCLSIGICYLFGALKDNIDAIRLTNRHLDHLVSVRTEELSKLLDKLLQDSEALKNSQGQELHDGIGQQLTGIQLLSSSIIEQLLSEDNPSAALGDRIQIQASKAHQRIRVISRLLFPIRISDVGLKAALEELSSALKDIKSTLLNIHFKNSTVLSTFSDEIPLQIYRICQELSIHVSDTQKIKKIEASLNSLPETINLDIKYAFPENRNITLEILPKLILYRLKRIGGTLQMGRNTDNSANISITISTNPKRNTQEIMT